MAYVNRENLIQLLAHENSNIEAGRQYYSAIYQKVMNMPTADATEVKHGEWKPIVQQDSYLEPPYCDTIKCSECGQEADVSFHDAKYCFECGAKMDGGKEE